MNFMKRNAILSSSLKYRYQLSREWEQGGRRATFILLNPSTADASVDDPTVRKCMGFAARWGMGGMFIGNLFAARARHPKDMMTITNPVGKDNYDHLELMCKRAVSSNGLIIAGWGAHGSYLHQDEVFMKWAKRWNFELKALQLTIAGNPWHPLYVPYEAQPFEFPQPNVPMKGPSNAR